jgi:hypothetical protein
MKNFSPFDLAVGQESKTDSFFQDAAGKAWPIYMKKLAVPALGVTAAVNILHGVAAPKLDAPMNVEDLTCSSGAGGATARTNKNSTGISVGFTATQLVITDTADLSAQSGTAVISYCKTTD